MFHYWKLGKFLLQKEIDRKINNIISFNNHTCFFNYLTQEVLIRNWLVQYLFIAEL